MKVICINGGTISEYYEGKEPEDIIVGNFYNVIDIKTGYAKAAKTVITAYRLKEIPSDTYWDSSLFAPLSNIDEKELVNKEFLSCPTL